MRIFSVLVWLLLWGCGVARAADAVPATAYFPVLPLNATENAIPQLVPVASNHALEGVQKGITRAIIVIHDDRRDANAALATVSTLAGSANVSTMILAPQFLMSSDIARFADHLPEKGKAFATWPISGWIAGDDSESSPEHKGVSSFTVIDLLLMLLSDRDSFPDLQTIIIAGSGAGGNFVQHYAAFGMADDLVTKQNIALRYLVADASSYLYLTPNRPLGGRKGFGAPNAALCPDFNAYPHGLDGLNPYGKHVGVNAAKTNYALRFVTYVNAPTADAIPESNCAALEQGTDSAVRAANYEFYLQSLYGDVAAKTQKFVIAKNAKNDAAGLFGSACGMEVLFGDGMCGGAP